MATIISVRSLETSQMAMKVGQRAYVSVENAKAGIAVSNRAEIDNGSFTIFIACGFTIRNLGNTPTRFLSESIAVRDHPGWTIDHYNWQKGETVPLDSKASKYLEMSVVFKPTPADAAEIRKHMHFVDQPLQRPVPSGWDIRGLMQFDVLFSASYVDVFDETHSLNWRETVSWDLGKVPKD